MSSKVYNFSDDYDYKTQRKCTDCGIVYNLTPEYGYDDWNLGHYGCHHAREYIKGYKDNGCPYCREKKKKATDEQIAKYEKNLKKCPRCNKAKISFDLHNYCIECDCVKTKEHVSFKWISKLIGIWNKIH